MYAAWLVEVVLNRTCAMAMSDDIVKTLVGLPVAEAETRVATQDSYVTIMSKDGVSYPVLTLAAR